MTQPSRDQVTGKRPAAGPRRSPATENRQRDAERSRQALLSAALEEFSARGYAGARVGDIAARAGVNKQLINYYFESKEGLYRAVTQTWLEREATLDEPDLALAELVARYLLDALADPRLMRLLIWRGLSDPLEPPPDITGDADDLTTTRNRQAAGEIAGDLHPAAVRLAIMGMVTAPVAMPQMVKRIFGLDPGSPEFAEHYAEQLRRIVRHLGDGSQDAPTERPTAGEPATDEPATDEGA